MLLLLRVLAVLVALSAPAGATPKDPLSELSLVYEAPPHCGSRQQTLQKLRTALGKDADNVGAIDAAVHVRTEGAQVILDYQARKGEVSSRRTLTLDSCEIASEAAALLLLLTLDPLLAESLGAEQAVQQIVQPASAPEPTPEPPAPPAPAPPAEPPRTEAPPNKAPPNKEPSPAAVVTPADRESLPRNEDTPWLQGGWLGVGGGAVTALGPSSALGVGLEGGVRLHGVRLGARGAWHTSSWQPLETPAGADVRASLLRAHLIAGLEFGRPMLRIGPWVGVGWERLSAQVRGITDPAPGSTALLAASGGVWSEVRITRDWGLCLRAGLLLPLEHPAFQVAGVQGDVIKPGRMGVDLFFGILWAFSSQ